VTVDSPSATAAIMTARCEQDLSPGARTDPAIRVTGLELARMELPSLVNEAAEPYLARET
jgi:hypothetical protein